MLLTPAFVVSRFHLTSVVGNVVLALLILISVCAEEQTEMVEESIKHAKECFTLDVRDGNSWSVSVTNPFMFFASERFISKPYLGYTRKLLLRKAETKEGIDKAKVFVSESIIEILKLQKDLKVFSISDYGCSVGPNTFSSVKTIIQAVQHKYKTQGPELKMPEFFVFFTDHVINDFNTLFRTLPPGRQYMAAGVPGSFQGFLFPKSSINLMHSASSLHWLSQVPEEVTKEDTLKWNKGRISYPRSSNQVIEAFRSQFFCDIEAFLKARSAELAPGGLLVMLYLADQMELILQSHAMLISLIVRVIHLQVWWKRYHEKLEDFFQTSRSTDLAKTDKFLLLV
ncbi:hypothetical protein ACH5RR_030149 [Cinchona calisaya]|uniref:Uncharacterized protein n=1 Tax=Cinchona calisaya TaxID=153742 RepID=A0ABD2YTV3_9GENT